MSAGGHIFMMQFLEHIMKMVIIGL